MANDKRMNYTFLITYFAQPSLLEICMDSIRKYHPGAVIIVSQEEGVPANVGNAKLIMHRMSEVHWAGVAAGLIEACKTDIGIFIEHDAFLMKSLDTIIDKIGEYDMVGVEENIQLPKLNRFAPGMAVQNFFILNVKKMKEIGLDKVYVRNVDALKKDYYRTIESGHGISQSLEKKLFLEVKPSGYAHGTYYGDYVHHAWFGSYRHRDVSIDGVDAAWMDDEMDRLISDYWENKFTQ